MNSYFNKYAAKGNEFLTVLSEAMGRGTDSKKAARVARAVLHTIRDHVPVDVSLQFMSSLPMMIKAVYADGWKPGKKKGPLRHKNDFIKAVREQEKPLVATHDFKDETYTAKMIAAVLHTLQLYVSEGEEKDLFAVFPSGIRSFLEELVSEKYHQL